MENWINDKLITFSLIIKFFKITESNEKKNKKW